MVHSHNYTVHTHTWLVPFMQPLKSIMNKCLELHSSHLNIITEVVSHGYLIKHVAVAMRTMSYNLNSCCHANNAAQYT